MFPLPLRAPTHASGVWDTTVELLLRSPIPARQGLVNPVWRAILCRPRGVLDSAKTGGG